MRLQQFIARCGVASRRKAEELIEQGLVKVNGQVILEPWFDVNEEKDWVRYNNKVIKPEKKVYIVMNKPDGYITSASDEKGRNTVIDLIEGGVKQRVYPVGRLDYHTTGCLLLTNDGDWANSIMHPKYEIPKKYLVKIHGRADNYALNKLKKGIRIDGKLVQAKEATVIQHNDKNDVISMVITEGLNHQVKKMLLYVGMSPQWLKRVSVGRLNANGLEYGQWRYLTQDEVDLFSQKSNVQGPKAKQGHRAHGPKEKRKKDERTEKTQGTDRQG